jgi:surfeit locus 1 family protein
MAIRFNNLIFVPRLIPSVVFVLLMILLLSLGNWQLGRSVEKQTLIQDRVAQSKASELVLNSKLVDVQQQRFRPARVIGYFDQGRQWLLDNRVRNGQSGYHVFTVFNAIDGQGVLVNRGWVATGDDRSSLPLLPVPTAKVELIGHLDRPESVGLRMDQPEGLQNDQLTVMQYVDVAEIAQRLGIDLLPYSLVLSEGQPGSLAFDWMPVEEITPEKHVGYAVQWFGLATALLIIYLGVNTKRATRHHDEGLDS